MRSTDDLILALASDVKAVPRHAVGWRISLGVAAGGAITLVLVVAVLGVRPDLHSALRDFSYWVRWVYTASIGIAAILMTASVARPDSGRLRWHWLLGAPVLLLTGIGIAEMAHAPVSEWTGLWLSRYWQICPWRILWLATPIFIGLLWAFRRFAPTRPRQAGAAAGLTAGAWSATLYCLHCPEVSAVFVLTWFSLGIALATAMGALLGQRLLRW